MGNPNKRSSAARSPSTRSSNLSSKKHDGKGTPARKGTSQNHSEQVKNCLIPSPPTKQKNWKCVAGDRCSPQNATDPINCAVCKNTLHEGCAVFGKNGCLCPSCADGIEQKTSKLTITTDNQGVNDSTATSTDKLVTLQLSDNDSARYQLITNWWQVANNSKKKPSLEEVYDWWDDNGIQYLQDNEILTSEQIENAGMFLDKLVGKLDDNEVIKNASVQLTNTQLNIGIDSDTPMFSDDEDKTNASADVRTTKTVPVLVQRLPKLSTQDRIRYYNVIKLGLSHQDFAKADEATTQALASLAAVPFHFHEVSDAVKKETYLAVSKHLQELPSNGTWDINLGKLLSALTGTSLPPVA
jgi:hypothetical protein